MTHLPRVPTLLQYPELYKSVPLSGETYTDYDHATDDVPRAVRDDSYYNCPTGRVNGNEMFRRLPNGMVDLPNAARLVCGALTQLKFGNPLNDMEVSMLIGCFPMLMATKFPDRDTDTEKSILKVKLRVSDQELAEIAMAASAKLMEMHEWLTFAIRV